MSRLPTAVEVTNLFLYKKVTTPTNMLDESLVRTPADFPPAEPIDVDTYMEGPGRFATPDKFDVVKKFLNPLTDISSFQLAAGQYTKAQLFSTFGITVGFVTIDQAQHDDGKDNFLDRAYIWNTTAFKVADDAVFVVEAGGNRYIKDFAIVPHLNNNIKENFDFDPGTTFGKIANSLLEPKCKVPCDHIPRRSWPLFKARAILESLLG